MHADDLKLARNLVAGDEKMFNQFFEQFFPRLYRFAFSRMSDESIIEDVVQSTMINAMRSMKNYRGEASMFTWLCQICRNEIAIIYRKQKKSVLTVTADDDAIRSILESLESESATPEQHYLDLEARKLLAEVLDFLPGNYGEALQWKYVLELSVTEIADRLELTDLATQSLLARARTSFRNALDKISTEVNPLLQE